MNEPPVRRTYIQTEIRKALHTFTSARHYGTLAIKANVEIVGLGGCCIVGKCEIGKRATHEKCALSGCSLLRHPLHANLQFNRSIQELLLASDALLNAAELMWRPRSREIEGESSWRTIIAILFYKILVYYFILMFTFLLVTLYT